MARVTLGDASKGEMAVGNGEVECAGCDRLIARGATIYWRCSTEMECDPYCGACVIEEAEVVRAICAALESGELRP